MNTFTPPNLYGIIGFPLGHSMSPLLHNTAFKALGIPGVFLPWQLEPEKLPAFVKAVRMLNIRGCSVTIPHKIALLPLLDAVTERVKAVGAANTLYWDGDKLCGENTDVLGFMDPFAQKAPNPDAKVLLLGAGGASRAVAAGLKILGLRHITVTDIAKDLPQELASRFALHIAPWEQRLSIPADIIINVTPLGMTGKYVEETPYPAEGFIGKAKGLAYDIVYTPYQTRFLREAATAGWQTISGREMFIAQGDAQFHLWTGHHLPQEAVNALIEALNTH